MTARPSSEYTRATEQAVIEADAHLAEYQPPPEPAPTLSSAEKAQRLRDVGFAARLYASSAPLLADALDIESWKIYADKFLEELGSPTDPVARMMAEQLALAHHTIANLHIRAASRLAPQEVAAFFGAIARLMAEFRRSALALKAYCEASPRREAAAPPPRAKRSPGGRDARRKKKALRTELPSNNRITEYFDEPEPALS